LINVAHAQTPAPLFQNATLTGSGNTITATRVPVVVSPTLTIYVDLTLQFNSDSNGNLTLASGFPQIVQSPALLTSNFVAGTYLGPITLFNGKGLIAVAGPGVTDAGATNWTLSATTGTDSSLYPVTANWYVGPIANNPYAARIQKAGITSTLYSYGIAECATNCPGNWGFNSNSGILIGVAQIGNTISIVSFTNQNTDSSTPLAQLSFTLQP
jgi:hypothetical protein